MSYRGGHLPSSFGEFVLILVFMVGIATMIAFAGSIVFWAVKTLLNVDYMTVLTHLIVGWIGAAIGLLIASKEDSA